MKKAVRFVALAGGILVVLGSVFVAWMERNKDPEEIEWKFLAGHKPTVDKLTERGWLMEGQRGSENGVSYADGPARRQRYQEYVIKGDYQKMLAEASKECVARGWKSYGPKDPGGYALDATSYLYVSEGLYDPKTKKSDKSQPYVRVMITAEYEETPAGRARRWWRRNWGLSPLDWRG